MTNKYKWVEEFSDIFLNSWSNNVVNKDSLNDLLNNFNDLNFIKIYDKLISEWKLKDAITLITNILKILDIYDKNNPWKYSEMILKWNERYIYIFEIMYYKAIDELDIEKIHKVCKEAFNYIEILIKDYTKFSKELLNIYDKWLILYEESSNSIYEASKKNKEFDDSLFEKAFNKAIEEKDLDKAKNILNQIDSWIEGLQKKYPNINQKIIIEFMNKLNEKYNIYYKEKSKWQNNNKRKQWTNSNSENRKNDIIRNTTMNLNSALKIFWLNKDQLIRTIIKERYRLLLRENHPDLFNWDKTKEENTKLINSAYTYLIHFIDTAK